MKLRMAPRFLLQRFLQRRSFAAALFSLLLAVPLLAHAGDVVVVSFGVTATPCAPLGIINPHLPACLRSLSFSPMSAFWGFANQAVGGKPSPIVKDFSFTKLVDSSSTTLLLDMLKGAAIPQMLVAVYHDTDLAAGKQPYYKALLKNVYVNSVSNADRQGVIGLPSETIALTYASLQVTYTYTDPSITGLQTITYSFDQTSSTIN